MVGNEGGHKEALLLLRKRSVDNHPEELFRFVCQQDGWRRLQGNSQLQERGKGDIYHSFFDLGDLTVVDATGIRHLAKAKTFLLTEFSQVLTEPF
jgi:hypothetical protein